MNHRAKNNLPSKGRVYAGPEFNESMDMYANNTKVPIDRSKSEIEKMLVRYGTDQFMYGSSANGAGIAFTYRKRSIKLNIPLPDRDKFSSNITGTKNYEQEVRRRWRVLALWLKAQLEFIETGLGTFEDVFLPYTALPNGGTVAMFMQPQIDQCILEKRMPQNLLMAGI